MSYVDKFIEAWNEFRNFYLKFGGKGKDENWGSYFREEADIVFHIARICTEKFGLGHVHLENPITQYWFQSYKGKKKHVDLDITPPKVFEKRDVPHEIFAEVKWIFKDIKKLPYGGNLKDKIRSIEKDLQKLDQCLREGVCKNAFMCIVDDEKATEKELENWRIKYPSVKILPSWLEIRDLVFVICPKCKSKSTVVATQIEDIDIHRWWKCNDCGHFWLEEVPDNRKLEMNLFVGI